ncbi:MAG: hypothetical protein LBO07_07125, partial [Coriobacteriales bacterium]|nr:hypothetical protein [Coriobacteriales bacterium]
MRKVDNAGRDGTAVRLALDPRTKLAVLVLISIFILTSPSLATEAVGVGLVALTVLAMGSVRSFLNA